MPSACVDAVGIAGDAMSAPWPTFARPKSRTLTTPSGVILMFAGFKSRWTMPRLVRGVERLGDLPRDPMTCRRQLGDRGRAEMRSASVSPSTSSSTRRAHAVAPVLDAVDGADVRMIERGEHPRLALEARQPLRVRR